MTYHCLLNGRVISLERVRVAGRDAALLQRRERVELLVHVDAHLEVIVLRRHCGRAQKKHITYD